MSVVYLKKIKPRTTKNIEITNFYHFLKTNKKNHYLLYDGSAIVGKISFFQLLIEIKTLSR